MHKHFSRVKDRVLVAVQRRDAGRATHETLIKNAREANRFEKRFFSSRALLFPQTFRPPLRFCAKAHKRSPSPTPCGLSICYHTRNQKHVKSEENNTLES